MVGILLAGGLPAGALLLVASPIWPLGLVLLELVEIAEWEGTCPLVADSNSKFMNEKHIYI